MMRFNLKQKMESVLEKNTSNKLSYIAYMDSGGNVLKENEILFTNEESFQGKQTLFVWGDEQKEVETYTIDSPGVELIYDSAGNFPIALKSPEGELMYLKVSAKTGEVLPIHAGCCCSIDIIYTGPPSAGKTVNILQLSDASFHDAIVRDTQCSFEDDLPTQAPARKRYEEAGRNLKKHVLPEPNRRGEIIMPYVFYVTRKEGNLCRHALVRMQDIDGQECIDMTWKSKIFPYNYFFLTIGADDLLAGEEGLPVQYTKVVDQLIPRLRVLRREDDYEIVVIISKSDLLDHQNPNLKDAFENSIEIRKGKMYQTVHNEGFNYEVFNRRDAGIRAFLKDECPNFYNKLVNSVPQENITFCMVASIGEKCSGNCFENYRPFCIDEPILSVLSKNGMYPVSVYGAKSKEGQVEDLFGAKGSIKKIMKLVWDSMIDDEEEDDC